MKSICLAILNYNGIHHLEELLPTAQAAVAQYGSGCPILILDNCSTDEDATWIRSNFPEVELIVAPKNEYLYSYNSLFEQRREDVIVLLNNDLRLDLNFLDPLLVHWHKGDENLFAVGATSRSWDGSRLTCGPARFEPHHGHYYWNYDTEKQELAYTLFASGGFMAVDRRKFLELGGFNSLFYPAYAEDLDLCFRAWRRGWSTLFEPRSLVYHREGGSWSKVGKNRFARLDLQSRLLFQWASLPRLTRWGEREVFYVWTALRRCVHGDFGWVLGLLESWWKWCHVRSAYAWMKTSPKEYEAICACIAKPVDS